MWMGENMKTGENGVFSRMSQQKTYLKGQEVNKNTTVLYTICTIKF